MGLLLAPGLEIAYVVKDAKNGRWTRREQPMSSTPTIIEGCWRRLGEKRLLYSSRPTRRHSQIKWRGIRNVRLQGLWSIPSSWSPDRLRDKEDREEQDC